MFKITTLAATAALALVAVSQPASARDGGAIAAGVGAGLVAGAIIGSSANRPAYYGGPAYYQAPYAPVYRHCYRTREWDGFRYRRVRVCD